MTEVALNCPGCEAELMVPENLFGKIIRCPGCENKLEIPMLKVKYTEEELIDNLLPSNEAKATRDKQTKTETQSLTDIKKNMLNKLKTEMNIPIDTPSMSRPPEETKAPKKLGIKKLELKKSAPKKLKLVRH